MPNPRPAYRALLLTYLRPQAPRVGGLATLLGGSIVLQLVTPQIVSAFLDAARTPAAADSLPSMAALFLGLTLVQQGLATGATYIGERVAWTATNALRADLMQHCLDLDLGFHKHRTPGEFIERIDGDVTAMANFFSQFVIKIVGSLLLLAGILVLLWTIDPGTGLTLAIFTALTLALMLRLRALAVPAWRALRQATAELFGFLEERLAGTVDIRANGAPAYVLHRLYAHLRTRLRAARYARLVGSIGWSMPMLATVVAQGLAFAWAAHLFSAGAVTLGPAFLIYYYTQLLFQPLNMIAHQVDDFQKASAAIIRVEELRQTGSTLADGPGVALPPGPPAVDFAGVTFGYEAAAPVLHDLTLHLAPGEVLGLLGRTGSGKTTLSRLLLRLYDPQAGAICIGGADLRAAQLADLRQYIGLVTQDVQLFQATVRENLTFFDPAISDARIWAALDELGLAEWYATLPAGLDTMLAAGGGGLSAGEAQLLAFTRVFLRDPRLVILDEASSRLDPATERLIARAVARLLAGRTAILIAHRLATVQSVDTILILEAGRVAEYGPRAALAAAPGSRFAALLQHGAAEVLV